MNDQSLSIGIKLLDDRAKVPANKSAQAAGWDIYCLENCVVQPRSRLTVRTGIAVAIPEGFYGHIFDRSGLAKDCGIHVLGGVIDSDYRGEVHVILLNTSIVPVEFRSGDRIAQMVFMPHYHASWRKMDELPATARGESGLGSTGR